MSRVLFVHHAVSAWAKYAATVYITCYCVKVCCHRAHNVLACLDVGASFMRSAAACLLACFCVGTHHDTLVSFTSFRGCTARCTLGSGGRQESSFSGCDAPYTGA